MAQLRMQTQVPGAKLDSRYSVDSDLLTDVKQVINSNSGLAFLDMSFGWNERYLAGSYIWEYTILICLAK